MGISRRGLRRYVPLHLHTHTDLCKVKYYGVGRPPTPWCERFYAKVEVQGPDDCWWWLPEKRWFENGGKPRNGTLNFTLNIPGYPRQVKPARWLWTAEIGPIDPDDDIDHTCEHYWCMNPAHFQTVHWLINSGELNKERGVYRKRVRDPHGRYIIPGESVRPTKTMGRKNTDDLIRDASGRFVSGR